jgi:hypothetical protein
MSWIVEHPLSAVLIAFFVGAWAQRQALRLTRKEPVS